MENILEKYYKLILKDKEYVKEHILNKYKYENLMDFIEIENVIWRMVNNYEELLQIVNCKDAMELLRFNDYYSDIMCKLMEEYLKIDFQEMEDDEIEEILSNDNLKKMLQNEHTPKSLKDCIKIYIESQSIETELYEYLMTNKQNIDIIPKDYIELGELKINSKDIKKCAIFVHYSINDIKRIEQKVIKLKTFCEEALKTNDYEIFVEIMSFLSDRELFNNMINRFERGEFSHLIVSDIGQIYKLSYDKNKTLELVDKIQSLGVTIICVDEKGIVEGRKKANDYTRD